MPAGSRAEGQPEPLQYHREAHLPSSGVELASSLKLVQEVAIGVGDVLCPEALEIPTGFVLVGIITNEDVDRVEFWLRCGRFKQGCWHWTPLARGKTAGCHGGKAMREELRRLCSIGLLRRRGDHKISELHSDLEFDLGVYVELTEFGQRWARRMAKIDEAASEPPEPAA